MSGAAAFELVGDVADAGPFLFTCEHASGALPDDIRPSESDRRLLSEHWGWDIGAGNVVRGLVAALGGQGVLSRFSRLLIDTNRLPTASSLVLSSAAGVPIDFNQGLSADEVLRRLAIYYEGYHQAIERVGQARSQLGAPFRVVSIHSFTPIFDGHVRPMEVGVLFDDFDDEAEKLKRSLEAQGFFVALNEPYSGRGPGALIYSAQRHGTSLGVKYLELEVRQDLIEDPLRARSVAFRLAAGLSAFAPKVRDVA